MKRLLILEHPEHYALLKERYEEGDLFIAFTPAAVYELERAHLPYRLPGAYYSHDDFFAIYQDCTANFIDTIASLDNLLWEIDARLKGECFQPFFINLYSLKVLIDNVKIFIYILNRIIKAECPEKIIAVSNIGFPGKSVDYNFLPWEPVCAVVLEKLKDVFHYKLEVMLNKRRYDISALRFLVCDSGINLRALKQKLRSWYILGKISSSQGLRILSVGSRDLKVLKPELEDMGCHVDALEESDFAHSEKRKGYLGYGKLTERIKSNKKIADLFVFESINFLSLVEEKLFRYCHDIYAIHYKYRKISDFIEKQNYGMIVVGGLSGLLVNFMIIDICRKKGIPCVCWMHGGYGAQRSFEGYDMSDLLLVPRYFVYGEAVSRAINKYYPVSSIGDDNFERAATYYPVRRLNTYIAGCPWMEQQYKNLEKPKNKKKVVAFIMGTYWLHNRYYMGGNSPYAFFQKWEETKRVLFVLLDFRNKYEIIVKVYPYDATGQIFLRRFLDERGGFEIKVIRDELSFDELLSNSDAAISPWVSTTVFQAAFSEADQLIFSDGDLTDEAMEALNDSFYFSKDIDEFCILLRDYLEKGNFYQKKKNRFREKFLDARNTNNRARYVSGLLKEIAANNPYK